MKYKVLLFDLDETLFNFRATEKQALKYSLSDFSIEGSFEDILKRYTEINEKLWRDLEKGLVTIDELRVKRFRILLDEIGEKRDAEEFSKVYMRYLGLGAITFPEANELIKHLSSKYRLGIVTNGIKEVQETRLERSGLKEYFEVISISEDLGVAKPDKTIFEYTLKKFKIRDKSSVLMIGDSLLTDIQGGINAGINTCWFNPHRKINESSIKPTYEIYTLLELYSML